MEGKYINGKKTGDWKYYWFNGTLSETENYKDGKLEETDISIMSLARLIKNPIIKMAS